MVCCILLPLAIITTHFLIISSSSSSSSSSSVSLPLRGPSCLRDAAVLIELKRSFVVSDDGLSSWNESNLSSVCSWAGVQCDLDRVVSVDISNYNISGTVSPSVAGLDCLRNLSFAGNSFSGVFPVEVSLLKELRYLNISNNGFNGTMEFWDFSEVKRFQVLDVYNNNFTGFLPVGFTNCSELKYLDLGGNFFNGKIPSSYGGFAKLEYLSLAGNDLNGTIPAELGNLTTLKQLYLGYYNVFDGSIPAELGRLINLVHLDLASCGLDGEIPRQLGELRSLNTLFLMTNFLSGTIPRELANLTGLVSLDLSNNGLTGEIPGEFEELKELKLLNLFMNRLHGSIPDFVAELPNLETLGLWQNNFTGVIPQKFGQNAKLQIVDLSTNKLTGLIPTGLCSGNTLRILILLNNFLFGPIPESLGRCTSLTRVRMGENYLNGSIPSGFLYLPEVNLMELQNNYLSGVLAENNNGGHTTLWPSKLGQLNLSNNCLSGTLPTSIANFSSLQILLLSSNRFSGKIPMEIGELQHVLKLDLSNNQLFGKIPAEINNCSMLNYLDLSQNQLIGEIPADINKIPILNYINVSHNHLSESLPETMGSMRSLTVADFSFNNFSGRVPDSGQFAYYKANSFAGNPLLCGTLLLNPCEFTMVSAAQGHSKGDLKLVLAIGLLVCSLIFAAGAFAKAWDIKRAHRSRKWKLTAFQKLDFSIESVLECLKESNIIGRGGAGIVYHGVMPNGEEIAVKRLMCIDSHNDHGFAAEIQTLGNIRHRNIVRLLAFCTNRESNLLVYEYMKNGSLGEVLHGKKGGSLLGWDLRYKIGMEAAQGLCYLHHDCSPLIVHRDVKSNNILLDSNFEAHVADFGLAKFLHNGGTTLESMSAVVGSYGYIAPEYAYTLKVDEKSDVYSFGVVLLELLTGRRPLGDFGDGVDIVQWVKETTRSSSEEQQDVVRVLDARLKKEVVALEEAWQMFFVAMMCLHEQSVERPTMREVVQMLSELPRKKNDNCIFSPSYVVS